MPSDSSTQYVNSVTYTDWQTKIKDLVNTSNDLQAKALASRKLRYQEIDLETMRTAQKLAPDELYIPMHLIDTNIRREQSSYIQYVTQSNRAAVLFNKTNPTIDASVLERDVTDKLRYEGWQTPMYANIDSFQQNGYSVMEVTHDQSKAGEVATEAIQLGDFGFATDSKDLQDCEIVLRKYYYSKTKLLALAATGKFIPEQVDKIVTNEATAVTGNSDVSTQAKDRSLYVVCKVMFRVSGVVHVAWVSDDKADNWISLPVPLFIGRKKATGQVDEVGAPVSEDVYETNYPYFLFPYLISENNTISQLKGRVFLDQDVQEAATSLTSSFCTAHRRGAGLYFSRNTENPNSGEAGMQKNVFFRTGALIDDNVKQFQLTAPGSEMLSAINQLVTQNMQETSQVNFAAMNRKDSRKTATEVSASTQSASALSTVQVVLFSAALRGMYQLMFDVIKSRVLAGLIKVEPHTAQLYAFDWIVKPSGDVDVIERQQLVQQMMAAWPVMQNTPANVAFLSDLISNMFPQQAQKYVQIFQQAQAQQAQQAQSAQGQMLQAAQQLAGQVVELSKHPEYFSDVGKTIAMPHVQVAAQQIEAMQKQQAQQPKQ